MRSSVKSDLTIVIPTFNRSQELGRALDGLVAQTDSDFDVIVCDDGSTEDIERVTRRFDGLLRLRLLRIANSGGPARPRNLATKLATTEWISYLDSDDWWYPTRINRLRRELSDDRDVVYHSLRVERADSDRGAVPAHGAEIAEAMRDIDPVRHMIRFGNPLATSGVTVKRELMLAIGGFDECGDLVSVEDFDAWLRLACNRVKFHFVPEVLGAYWVGSDQISAFNLRQFERQRYLFRRQLALLPVEYRAQAGSNFGYLLGGYALELGLPDAESYFGDLSLTEEPLRWLKAHVKVWSARLIGSKSS